MTWDPARTEGELFLISLGFGNNYWNTVSLAICDPITTDAGQRFQDWHEVVPFEPLKQWSCNVSIMKMPTAPNTCWPPGRVYVISPSVSPRDHRTRTSPPTAALGQKPIVAQRHMEMSGLHSDKAERHHKPRHTHESTLLELEAPKLSPECHCASYSA